MPATGTPAAPLVAIGVDGAQGGWAAALLYADARHRREAMVWQTRLALLPDIAAVARERQNAGASAAVAVDIPIGLLDSVDFRPCDLAARLLLKQRVGSVFMPPARYMLSVAGDYPAIRALVEQQRQHNPAAKSLSAQAAGITRKVAEVDEWVRVHPESEQWLFECHPELSFLALNDGAPLGADKSAPAGVMRRLKLVEQAFPDSQDQLATTIWPPTRRVQLADLLDAYAALSTALVCVRGEQEELGEGERDSEGVLMRMAL
jgi:predicted RNase H-like nuclease